MSSSNDRVLSDGDRAAVLEVERYVRGKVAKYAIVAVVIAVVASAVSLAFWQPWATKKRLQIENTAIVHSQEYVRGKNADLAVKLAALRPDFDQAGAVANQIRVTASMLDWSEINVNNQAMLCRFGLEPATASC